MTARYFILAADHLRGCAAFVQSSSAYSEIRILGSRYLLPPRFVERTSISRELGPFSNVLYKQLQSMFLQ
jgi:hypothetical protein